MTGLAAAGALGAAACFGAGDFLGGVATRRLPGVLVVAASHLLSLLALTPVAVLAGATSVGPRDLLLGSAAGVVGGVGVALLYASLSRGLMSVSAPVTAAVGAGVPVAVGFLIGDRPSAAAVVGVVVAVAAVVLLSRHPDGPDRPAAAQRAFIEALGAGAAFGVIYVLLDLPGSGSGLWPLVSQRLTSALLFGVIVLAGPARAQLSMRAAPPRLLAAVAACGLLDTTANVLYLTATRHGLLALVAVLASLYPAGTVLLARIVLDERLRGLQMAGLGLALAATALIAL